MRRRAVANLYYAQPLLHTIARALSVSNSMAALLATGYAMTGRLPLSADTSS